MLPLTLVSFVVAVLAAFGAGSAWLAGASDLATAVAVVGGLFIAVSVAVTIATRIMVSVLAARDSTIERALVRIERDALRPLLRR